MSVLPNALDSAKFSLHPNVVNEIFIFVPFRVQKYYNFVKYANIFCYIVFFL